jgi:muramoyltetrapeptide carboxypeptidase
MRIAIVAPSCTLDPLVAERLPLIAAEAFGADAPELIIHPQCFFSKGHFAGPDDARIEALVEVANDPDIDAIWFARGGYGACRVAEAALDRFTCAAGDKLYMGYSDAGFLLAGLYARGIGQPVHGPMPADLKREGGEAAIRRALGWLINPQPSPEQTVAFNLTVLSQLLGTSLQPDLAGHVLMIEDVAEYLYRTDRSLFHLTSNPAIRQVAGIRLGRFSLIPDNDPDFGQTEEQIAQHWCATSGIPYLGRADIGHDVDNKVVPFGWSD